MKSIEDAIARVRDGSSLYWAFYHPDHGPRWSQPVEVRLDGSSADADHFAPPEGWTLHRVQSGDSFFLRRRQSIERAAVEDMLVELLQFAGANGMYFHSWLHGDLD